MKCRYLLIFFTFLLFSCETNISSNKKIKYSNKSEVIFVNKGFALIYDDDLIEKKLINKKMKSEDLIIFQHKLKKNITKRGLNDLLIIFNFSLLRRNKLLF